MNVSVAGATRAAGRPALDPAFAGDLARLTITTKAAPTEPSVMTSGLEAPKYFVLKDPAAQPVEEDAPADAPLVNQVGTDFTTAVTAAHAKANSEAVSSEAYTSQAVLQGKDGAYYVGSLSHIMGFDDSKGVHELGSGTWGSPITVEVEQLNPALKAVVGGKYWKNFSGQDVKVAGLEPLPADGVITAGTWAGVRVKHVMLGTAPGQTDEGGNVVLYPGGPAIAHYGPGGFWSWWNHHVSGD